MSRRRWEEAKHPRDRIGRFAGHPGGGGAWAQKISDSIPAPGGTKRRSNGPGTIEKPLNQVTTRDSVYHEGEKWDVVGVGVDNRGRTKRSHLILRQQGEGLRTEIKVRSDEHPTVRVIRKTQPVTAPKGRDAKRMSRWRQDALQPGRGAKYTTQRDYLLERESRALQESQGELEYAIQKLLPEAKKKRLRGQALQNWLDDHTAYERSRVFHAQQFIDHVKNSKDPVYDKPPQYGADQEYRLAQKPDPEHPLAVYGDMLHIGGGQNVYDALAAMEDTIPWEIHATLADFMAKRDEPQPGGIWLSSRAVSDMDHSHDLKGEQPRGWGEGKTWDDVNGVHRPYQRTVLVGLTDNTHGRKNGTADTARHELGHALDHAFGDASGRPGFTMLHSMVKKEAKWLSPYFRQPGTAGAQEFWAEAFHVWARTHRDTPDNRTEAFMGEFGLSPELARELRDYYDVIYVRATEHAAGIGEE